ncbi:MAG: class II aldolase/adducin family protein [Candidatus Omnitrophota bacterium]
MKIQKQLVKYGKKLHEDKFVIGAGGNISAKEKELIFIKKKYANMSKGRKKDYLPLERTRQEMPDEELFSSETPMHLACYEAREDIGAVIHVHSPLMTATAFKTDVIKDISYEADCVIASDVPIIEYIQPGSKALAAEVSDKIKKGANAVLMKRHGALTVGKDLEEAYMRILALERACISYLMGKG